MPRPTHFLFGLLVAASVPASAQAPSPEQTPFGTVAVSVGPVVDVRRSADLARWEPGAGIEARALFPFYSGSVEVGAVQTSYDSRSAGVPGFRGRYVFVGWGLSTQPVRRLTWRTGVRIGVYDFQFDDESIPDYARSENEVGTELVTELDVKLGRGWSLAAGTGGRVIFTEPRIRQLSVSAAVRRTFAAPEWLRDFLD